MAFTRRGHCSCRHVSLHEALSLLHKSLTAISTPARVEVAQYQQHSVVCSMAVTLFGPSELEMRAGE